MPRTLHWGFSFPIVCGLVLAAVPARAQSLVDALVSAYLTRPEIQADRARQRALDEDVARARGGWRPQVSLNGQYGFGRDRIDYGYLNPPQSVKENINPESYGLQVTQPIYDGGKTAADVERSKSAVIGGLAHAASVEESVLADAVQGYYDLYRDQELLELAKKSVEALNEQLASVRARFDKKDATVADLSQVETRLAQGIALRVAAEGAVAVSRAAFKQATGLQPLKLAAPPPLPKFLLPKTRDEVTALAIDGPSVREAELAIKTAEADVKGAQSALKPVLSLEVMSDYQNEVSQGHFKTWYNEILGNLQVPLYMGGADYAKVREAKTIVGQRKLEADETREQSINRAVRAWEQLQTTRGRLAQLKLQVDAADRAWHALRTEVKAGYREVIDELNAEQEFFNSENALTQAQHDEAVAAFSLLSWSGRLTAHALRLPVALYDPKKNYDAESGRWFGTGIPDNDDVRRSPSH